MISILDRLNITTKSLDDLDSWEFTVINLSYEKSYDNYIALVLIGIQERNKFMAQLFHASMSYCWEGYKILGESFLIILLSRL